LQYINEHYLEDISLTSVAQKIGYSKEHCSKIFSESVGMGFRDYLSFLRLKKAQEYFSLKKDLKLTTIEIIYKCGFKSTATFYRAQKRFKDKNIKN
jgi:two-component system response regulator YesN